LKILYNEEVMGKMLLEKGYSNGYTFYETLLVARYLYHKDGLKGVPLKKKIIAHIEVHDPLFASHTRYSMLKEIMKKSTLPFVSTGTVTIYEDEISKIREIKNFKFQKIALAILLVSKRATNKGTINIQSFREVKHLVSHKITRQDILNCLYHMRTNLMIEVFDAHKFKEDAKVWYKVIFSRDHGIPVFIIENDNDAKKIGKRYEEHCGGIIGFCSCGAEFIRTNNYQRMCSNCAAKRKHRKVNV
jgi:hypothetical protein